MATLNQKDRHSLELVYGAKYGDQNRPTSDALHEELRQKLSPEDAAVAQAILNRKDSKTNDAGNLLVAITQLHGAHEITERSDALLNSQSPLLLLGTPGATLFTCDA
jgi:hypothetical protein